MKFFIFLHLFLGRPADHCFHPIIGDGIFIPESTPIKPGTKGQYKCNPGFKLVGNSDLVCTESKIWHGSPAVCEKIPVRGN